MARLIRDYTASAKMNKLSANAERLFMRMLQRIDDAGNYQSTVNFILGDCFPIATNIRITDVANALAELHAHKLFAYYTVADKKYIHVFEFNQKLNWKPNRWYPESPLEIPKEKSTKKEKEVQGQVQVQVHKEKVVVVVPEPPPDHHNLILDKCLKFCHKSFARYFPADVARIRRELKILTDQTETLILKNPNEKEKILSEFNAKADQFEINQMEAAVRKEFELFWAYNEAESSPIANRYKLLKLWLLRKEQKRNGSLQAK